MIHRGGTKYTTNPAKGAIQNPAEYDRINKEMIPAIMQEIYKIMECQKMYDYDYREAVKNDVLEYIREEIDLSDYDNLDQMTEELFDILYIKYSVNGYINNSYTSNRYTTEEYLNHNLDLLREAAKELDFSLDELLEKGVKICDVIIRCHLLSECLYLAIEEIKEDFEEAHKSDGKYE